MEIYKKLEAQMDTIRYIILVFMGAGINFTVGFAVMFSGLTALLQSPIQTLSSKLPQSVSLLVTCYFFIGIVYSTSASLSFYPKRIVSPLYIQITTAAFVPIIIWFLLSTVITPFDFVTGSLVAFSLFLFTLVIFFVAGIGQTIVVRYLVGLNGTKQDVNSFGLIISAKLEDVLKVLRSDDVIEVLNFYPRDGRRTGEHSYIFRTPLGARQQIFIAIIEDTKDKEKTQLATISYVQRYYRTMKTGQLLEEQRRNTIESALKKAGITFSDDNTDSPAKLMAYTNGLSITESRLLGLRSLPPYSKAIIIGLTLMTILMTALRIGNIISLEMYETFLVFAGFSLLFDLLPLLRIKRKNSESY
jgi:hypothetical protein